ncbi:MAG TPA: HNH endonuclease [Alphaproteobacteria bacterium]|nr:HNH endonuclease [Alphaproteobacteria bacterium]
MTEATAELRAPPLGGPQQILDAFRDMVDLLLPLLKPYEAAIYVHLFRHSWADTGQPLVRLSYRSLRTEVVKTNWRRRPEPQLALCSGTIRKSLVQLAAIGAIRREDVARNHGAMYRVLLPRDIAACRQRAAEAGSGEKPPEDFYNVRANRRKVYERDGYTCRYCGTPVAPYTATLDHLVPVAAGGSNGIDNLVTACLSCNTRKGRKPLGDFLAEQNPM